ncbi:MAG: hypothetical protein R3B82_09310 [Sandaracinaceae bacterium]
MTHVPSGARAICAAWLVLGASGCDFGSAESVTEHAVERTVEVGRGIGSGIVRGARDGREGTTSTDGARVVGSWDPLEGLGDVEVVAIRGEGSESVVELRFTNRTDAPLRVAHLSDAGQLLALDAQQVAVQTTSHPEDLTVFANARQVLHVRFPLAAEEVREVRLWGHALSLPS